MIIFTHCKVVVAELSEIFDEHLLDEIGIDCKQVRCKHMKKAAERSFIFEFTGIEIFSLKFNLIAHYIIVYR